MHQTKYAMRFLARVFFALLLLISVVGFTQLTATSVSAQNNYSLPNTEANVPIDQHTLVQSVFIESLSAIGCQLSGIDAVDPTRPCLGINPETHKLGYLPAAQQVNGQVRLGGLMGATADGIGILYHPGISSTDYAQYMANSFGIVKSSYAAPITGFEGLSPVLNLWKISRDLAYYALILVSIFIGLGIMLRLRMDPRTVMNIQNQLPRVVVCIIMITFSYPLAGVMVDGLWGLTYIGINAVTEGPANTAIPGCKTGDNLRELATNAIQQSPISFGNQVFLQKCNTAVPDIGLVDISGDIANSIAAIQVDLVLSFLGIDGAAECSSGLFTNLITHPIDCILYGISHTFWKVLFSAVWFIIILAAILFSLFRIWFALLKAFGMLLIYTATGPIWFVFGLLPKRPLGVERWVRGFGSNALVFPATATLLVVARQFQDQWNHGTKAAEVPGMINQVYAQPATTLQYFVPPLTGNPNSDHFGSVVAFSIILLSPSLISLLQEKLGATPLKQAAAIGAGIAAGAAIPGMASKKTWAGLTRHNPQTGAPEAPISRLMHKGKTGFVTAFTDRGKFGNTPLKGMATKTLERMRNKERNYGSVTDKERDALYPTNAHRNLGPEQQNQNNLQQARGNQGRTQGQRRDNQAQDEQGGKPRTFRERWNARRGKPTQAQQQPSQAPTQGAAKSAQGQEVKVDSLTAEKLTVAHIDLPENKGSMQVPFEGNNRPAGEYLQTIMGDRTPHLPDITWHSKAMHELNRAEQDELLELLRGHLNS